MDHMRVSIDVDSPLPVFAQLVSQVRSAVQSGQLQPGDSLPPIRQLAADLQINPNTVAKAYGVLERDAIIETRGRHGSFVHREGRKHSYTELTSRAAQVLSQAVARLRDFGLTDSEIRVAFAQTMRE